ncbi:MAG: OmpA family protein [Myxococcota bacterium]|jgi:outer membrane protein OmpA-like peptidoglycan-associated protein|nr:OmpA family protein [Myxococcota bacterium]
MPSSPEQLKSPAPEQVASKDGDKGGGTGAGKDSGGGSLKTGLTGEQVAQSGSPSPESEKNGKVDEEKKKLEEENKKKEAFAKRVFELKNHIPSTGMGKFDAAYKPKDNQLDIKLKLAFDFLNADDTPGPFAKLLQALSGKDVSKYYWSENEKKDYVEKFKSRVKDRWSKKHIIKSIKKNWEEFNANTEVTVEEVPIAQKSQAHFYIKAHKVSTFKGPIEYKSAVNNEQLIDPTAQTSADLYSSDNTENPDFNSAQVATTERQRIDGLLTSSGAGRVLFDKAKSDLNQTAKSNLNKLVEGLKKVRPNDPRIPLIVKGFASPEGDAAFNQKIAGERAEAVKTALNGVPQPVTASSGGITGTPEDAQARKAEVSTDTTFETTYQGNKYSVSEHEAGHMLGMPDEYLDNVADPGAHPALKQAQIAYEGLVQSAGLEATTYAQTTSSQMSAGVDIMPSHYVTFWEALGKMTDPDIKQGEWKIGG